MAAGSAAAVCDRCCRISRAVYIMESAMPLLAATRLDIRFVGLPALPFLPRWKCLGEPVVQVIAGPAGAIQRAMAMSSANAPRLAIIIGDGFVDCANLQVRVASVGAARQACNVLVSLSAGRAGIIADVDAFDLRQVVVSGCEEGVIVRQRAPTLIEAARRVSAEIANRQHLTACIGLTVGNFEGCLNEVSEAMAILGADGDEALDLVCLLRSPPGRFNLPTIEFFAGVM